MTLERIWLAIGTLVMLGFLFAVFTPVHAWCRYNCSGSGWHGGPAGGYYYNNRWYGNPYYGGYYPPIVIQQGPVVVQQPPVIIQNNYPMSPRCFQAPVFDYTGSYVIGQQTVCP